jgi:16S rRNA (cytidine1402-2'-O)-methyltransferase
LEKSPVRSGTLYIVPTPIGNLGDITHRAITVLSETDLVLCEDTRTSGKLLQHYGIDTPTRAHHMHNEHREVERLTSQLSDGMCMALISDAGTPAISDPGFLLVRSCLAAGVNVITLPGPTAFVPALVQSGLPCERFVFEGFLPHKKGRKTRIEALANETRTMVFYESPHRLVKTLQQLAEAFGSSRQASVSREITKLYEETQRGTLSELHTHFENHAPKGELVLVVGGKS